MRVFIRFIIGLFAFLLTIPAIAMSIATVASVRDAVAAATPHDSMMAMGELMWSIAGAFLFLITPAFIGLALLIEQHLHRVSEHAAATSIAARSVREMLLDDHKQRKALTPSTH